MRRDRHREAWTAFIEQREPAKESKYRSQRSGKYSSKHEEQVARNLWALADRGTIQDLREQVRFVLVPGDGKLRAITYIADFVWMEDGRQVVGDAKGFKTQVYRLKKKMLKLLHGIEIREL